MGSGQGFIGGPSVHSEIILLANPFSESQLHRLTRRRENFCGLSRVRQGTEIAFIIVGEVFQESKHPH